MRDRFTESLPALNGYSPITNAPLISLEATGTVECLQALGQRKTSLAHGAKLVIKL
jgi:hypothetical protein